MQPTPYSGNEPYIFISYAHKDREKNPSVDKIIMYLKDKGFRVWFDDDLVPASEWDEKIANQVKDCSYFIALMSRKYLKSSNCKDELKYSRSLEKKQLIIYLEECELPPGIEMRTNRMQSLFEYKYESFSVFGKKLEEADGINICKETEYNPTDFDESWYDDFEDDEKDGIIDKMISKFVDLTLKTDAEGTEDKKPKKIPRWFKILRLQPVILALFTGLWCQKPLWRYATSYEEGFQIPAYQTVNTLINAFYIIHAIMWVLTLIILFFQFRKFGKKSLSVVLLVAALVVSITVINYNNAAVATSPGKCTEKIMIYMCTEDLHNRIMQNENSVYDCEAVNFPRERLSDYVYGDFFYSGTEYVVLTRNNTKQWDIVTIYMDLPDDVYALYIPTKNLRNASVSGMYGG